jgi:hypothetical protein
MGVLADKVRLLRGLTSLLAAGQEMLHAVFAHYSQRMYMPERGWPPGKARFFVNSFEHFVLFRPVQIVEFENGPGEMNE